MDLILKMGFADYFLFVSDAVRWGKDHGIPFGPGRGSAAASVVCWLARITEVDPHRYQSMIFERFIDVSRSDPPDIDLDVSDEHRELLREYLAGKYGAECVGQIANYVYYRSRNSIDDIARVYQIPKAIAENVKGLIVERARGDASRDDSIRDSIGLFPAVASAVERFPGLRTAADLEGNVRNLNIHAAGIIVANSPLTDICATYERNGVRVLSLDKYDFEYAGALKLDILGLSTMGMISRCLEMTGLTLADLYAIPDDDPAVLDLFRNDDVTGIFQFDGGTTRTVNRAVKPETFLHLADISALARPGPLHSGTTSGYIKVRHGKSEPDYAHPLIAGITGDTYGQLVYQEQVLRVIREIGGFDWELTGKIRRIIGKSLGEAAFREHFETFASGAESQHGIGREASGKIWELLVTSGAYSFNISHAISYTVISVWTAWLKVHHPLEFYAASLAKAQKDEKQRFRLMRDAREHGIPITPPSLNLSSRTWKPADPLGLLAGWEQIPGIAAKTAMRIDAERLKGDFSSWADLTKIPGIGPVKVAKMEEFSCGNDPFGLDITGKLIASTKKWLRQSAGRRSGIPFPNQDGIDIAKMDVPETEGFSKGPAVAYIGVTRERTYRDAAESQRSRTGEDIEEILKRMKRPELRKNCSVWCYDTTDQEVVLRISRFAFPALERTLASIRVGHDLVIAAGNRMPGFGAVIMVKDLYVIDPD